MGTINLTVKLFSSLMEYLPPSAEGNSIKIQGQAGTSCESLLDRLRVPPDAARVIMVNGEYVSPEKRSESLSDGDTISIWPAIQGG